MSAYLEPGEQVVLEARPHGVALVRPLSRAVVVAGAGAACLVFGGGVHWLLATIGAACLAVAALLALSAIWRWDRTAVVLTTQKLFVVYGVLRRRAAAVRLERVAGVEVDQSLLGRLLGYGTLVAGNLEIPHVPRAREVLRRLG